MEIREPKYKQALFLDSLELICELNFIAKWLKDTSKLLKNRNM